MITSRHVVSGIVKNGLIVPEEGAKLPEGAHVEILFTPVEIPAELKEEFEFWEQIGDDAWAMIDQWEKEDNR